MISIAYIENKGLLSTMHSRCICFFNTIDELLPAGKMRQGGFIVIPGNPDYYRQSTRDPEIGNTKYLPLLLNQTKTQEDEQTKVIFKKRRD